jgi:hypothetical protein
MAVKNMAGKVPRPKNIMNNEPFKASPDTVAPANAIYTKPQGSKPLSSPVAYNEAGLPLNKY